MGGSTNPHYPIRNYDILISAAYKKLKLTPPDVWREKRKFVEERKNEQKDLLAKLFF
jgi:hypothetical protein